MQVTFHKVAEAEVEAASRGAHADENAHMTGQPETPSQWQFHNTYQAECSHMSHWYRAEEPPHLQVTFHKVAEAEVEAASRGASADEVAHMTGQPENASLVTLLKGGALSVTIKKGTTRQRPGTSANPRQPDLANQVSQRRCAAYASA